MNDRGEPARFGRGLAGFLEASWSGEPGTIPWSSALAPLASLYAFASDRARKRATAGRRRVPGVYVIAVGNLTVGGTGKSSLARWIAAEASRQVRSAVVLRGHGAVASSRPGAEAVPDFASYPLRRAAERYGDEAAAHRSALPVDAAVIVARSRRAGACLAHEGYGASVVVLDDGWEQGTLAWDALWVALDPDRPVGNGRLLPAGPLRRPPASLREATGVVFVLEGGEEGVPPDTLRWLRAIAPELPAVRFRRVLHGIARPGIAEPEPRAAGGVAAALLTGVGAPARVERFARAWGIDLAAHATFPDHARVAPERLREAMARAARQGAGIALITEKDEHRWTLPSDSPLPVRVLRTRLEPLDPTDAILRGVGSGESAGARR